MAFITLANAVTLTTKCRSEKIDILKTEYQENNIIFTCETFEKEDFETLLAKDECVGIRIYTGMDTEMRLRAIVVGVDGNNEDILPENDSDNCIIEQGIPCPPNCPPPSPLNE